MDLANLGFVVDTKSIKDGISALRELQAAALGVTNSFKNVEGQAARSNKKATQEVDAHVLAYKKSLADKERTDAKVQKAIEAANNKRLQAEASANDQAVALFRANELKKQKQAEATEKALEQSAQKKLDVEKTAGDQAVALFRQNQLKKQREAERLEKALELNANKRLQLELTTGDQAVALFRANELKKQQVLQRTQDAHVVAFGKAREAAQRYADTSLKAVQKQLQQVKIEAELAAQGLSRTTAVGVANLRGRGASEADVNTFIRTRKEIERITEESKKAGVATQGLSTILRQISPAVGAVGVVALFTQIGVAAIRAADQMTLLKSRMRLVLDETQDFTSTYDNLINTAVENRASLTDTVTLFVRLTPALRAAGLEASAANKVVDSFQKTLLISGATTRETSAAILQFSQAMAAGRLNGDEFRSISEAAPEFLRAFSKATGVAAGALKELSAEGVLTTEVISAAMIVMNEELTKAAAGIEINLGQAIQILGTRLTESADRINSATGFTQALAQTVFSLGETVKSVTDFIINNKDAFAGLASTLGTVLEVATISLTIYAGLKGVLLAVSLAGAGVTAVFTGLAGAASFAQLALAKYTGSATTAAVATTGLGVAVKGLLSSTGIGAIAVVLGTAAVAFSDYIFTSDEAAETSNKVTEATEEETKAIEAAKKILSDFGITYGSASGAAGEYAKKTKELTNAYIQQKVSAEGLYLIEKNLIELERAKLVVSAAKIASSEKDTETKNKEIAGIVKEIEAINDLLGIMQLTEEARAAKEKASKAATKATKTETAAEKEAVKVQKELEKIAKDRIKDYEKLIEEIDKNTEAVLKEVAAIEEETARIGLSTEQIRLREIALLESAIATKEAELASKDFATSTYEEIQALEDFIAANKKKVAALRNQDKGLNDQKIIDDAKKASEATAKEFEKIQDDIAKAVGDAIISGGQKGKDILKNMFKAQIFRIFIEPTIRGGVAGVVNTLGLGRLTGNVNSSVGSLDVAGIANLIGQGSSGGLAGIALNQGLQQLALNPQVLENIGNSIFFNTTGALSEVGRSLATNASSLSSLAGEIAPYAGSIISLLQGDFRGAIGGAAGTALGGLAGSALSGAGFATLGAIAGPLGAALGATLGKKLFGGGKISATALSPEFGSGVKKTLEEQYLSIVKGLGGVAANVTFNAFGNTGRQGQNPNFTLGAFVNGRNVFGSAQTREGQADGLFLSGEIALNEANLAEQSLRAIFSVLKETDFDESVNSLFDSVNAATDSMERLNDVLAQVKIVKFLNQNLTVFSSNIRNLINVSADAFQQLVETAGGTEAFSNALSVYVNTFATDSDKLQSAQRGIAQEFDRLNLTVPKNIVELRKLIDAQDLTTEAGRQAYLSLINLIPAFSEVKEITDRYTDAQKRLSESVSQSLKSIQESFSNFTRVLQQRSDSLSVGSFGMAISSLQGSIDSVDTSGVNSSITSLQNQITQLQSSVSIVDFSRFTNELIKIENEISSLTNEIANTSDLSVRLSLEDQLQQRIIQRYQLEQELLTGVFENIQELLGSITSERVQVRQAAINIISGGNPLVMSASQIRSGVASAAALGSLPSTSGIDSANSEVARLNSRIEELNSTLGSQQANKVIAEAQLTSGNAILGVQKEVARQAVRYFENDLLRRTGVQAYVDRNNQAIDLFFDEQSSRVGASGEFWGLRGGDPAAWRRIVDNEKFKDVSNFSQSDVGDITIRQAFDSANARIISAEQSILNAQLRLSAALSAMGDASGEIERTQQLLKVAEENRIRAQEEFVKQIQEFVIDAGKAVTRLSRLREETVKYYEAQKQLADLLNSTAAGLRATVGNIRFADLNPLQQLGNLQDQFDQLFNRAQGATGEELSSIGSGLQGLIDPILQKAAEVYASGPEFQRIKELVLGQALSVAEMLEELAPKNYQEESLAILDTIDSTLALIEQNTKSAETLIVDAIGASTIKTVEALRAVIAAINGEPIPAFAKGGFHTGGFALVGEEGPELVNMGASRVFSANQTANMLGGRSVDVTPVVEALNRVQDRTEFQIRVLQEGFRRMDERQQVMQEELTDIRKKGNLATQ